MPACLSKIFLPPTEVGEEPVLRGDRLVPPKRIVPPIVLLLLLLLLLLMLIFGVTPSLLIL